MQKPPTPKQASPKSAGPKPLAPTRQTVPEEVKPKIEELEIDYAPLLVELAEDYIDAAYKGSRAGPAGDGNSKQKDFFKLIATGLGCLEVVLKVALLHLESPKSTNGPSNGHLP